MIGHLLHLDLPLFGQETPREICPTNMISKQRKHNSYDNSFRQNKETKRKYNFNVKCQLL